MKTYAGILLLFLALTQSMCTAQKKEQPAPYAATHPGHVQAYWYAGEAELNHYELQQSRYGELRDGEAVLVYVTEDFLKEEQVKHEFGEGPSVSVLKLNSMKKFITGIYDYSIMSSTFTPMDYTRDPVTLKSTFSSQDWCGQSFSQMNFKDRTLTYQLHSYFQNEGDTTYNIEATYVEEDIWTRARIEPQMLPMGKIQMVPSQEYARLNHVALKAYEAHASLVLQVNDSKHENPEFYIYRLSFPELERSLEMTIQSSFPFKILAWEEQTHTSNPQKSQKTTAKLTHTDKRAYWQENAVKNESLRDSLGMRFKYVE